MSTPSLRKPPAAKTTAPKLSRTDLDLLIRQRQELNERRLALDRESAGLGKQVSDIDKQLLAIVDAEAVGPDRSITLKCWRLSIVQVAASVSWLSEFTKRCGQELVNELKAACGTRDKLSIESREKPAAG